MKKTLLFILLIAISQIALSQTIFFASYEDFVNDKPYLTVKRIHSTGHVFGNFKIEYYDEDDRIRTMKISKKEMWGYVKDNGQLMRIDSKSNPYLAITFGKLIMYTNSSTSIDGDKITFYSNQFVPQVSAGLNGEMIKLNKNALYKLIKFDFQAIADLKNYNNTVEDWYKFIVNYNAKYE